MGEARPGWEPYDPAWLVTLAREQLPEAPALADALESCTVARAESRAYLHFVDPQGPDWRFRENVALEHPREGTVVLDVLEDGRVGGIEMLSRLG